MPQANKRDKQHAVHGQSFLLVADDLDANAAIYEAAATPGTSQADHNKTTAIVLQKVADAFRREGKRVRSILR